MRNAWAAAVVALFAIALIPAVRAAAPNEFSDAADGVGCRHYSVGGKLAWGRAGGDWEDRDGEPYGDTPFASAVAGKSPLSDGLAFDVTALVREWLGGERPNTGLLLRAVSGQGVLQVPSREAEAGSAGPVLELEWRDGRREDLVPVADATLDCSTWRGIGTSKRLRIGPDVNTLVVFQPSNGAAGELRRAHLRLQPQRLYGKSLTIGVFSPTPPWAALPPPKLDGIASRHPLDDGLDGSRDVLFTADFEQSDWASVWNKLTKSEMTTVGADEGNGFEPLSGRALKTTLKRGANTALNLRYLFARHHAAEPEEVYFRYYLRLGADWNPDVEGGKLPGLAGTYGKGGWGMRPSDGTNGWSVRGGFSRALSKDATSPITPIGSYVYHAKMKGNSGHYWGWNEGPGGLLLNDRWYAIEQYVRLNTPGEDDGVFRAWIDGHQVVEKTGLSFRAIDALRIESVWMNVYHGGSTAAPRDMSLYIDNVVVARSYIGPVSGRTTASEGK